MAGMLELPKWEFKISMINMVRALMDKVVIKALTTLINAIEFKNQSFTKTLAELISSSACKKLGSHHSIQTSTKLNRLNNS